MAISYDIEPVGKGAVTIREIDFADTTWGSLHRGKVYGWVASTLCDSGYKFDRAEWIRRTKFDADSDWTEATVVQTAADVDPTDNDYGYNVPMDGYMTDLDPYYGDWHIEFRDLVFHFVSRTGTGTYRLMYDAATGKLIRSATTGLPIYDN